MKKKLLGIIALGMAVSIGSFNLDASESADKADGRSVPAHDKADGRSITPLDKADGR